MRTSLVAAILLPRSLLAAAIIALLAGGFAGRAAAGVYKCVSEGGAPMYQDSPCLPGKELRNFDTDPAEVSVIPFRAVPDLPPSTVLRKSGNPPPYAKTDKTDKADKRSNVAAGADPTQRKFIASGMSESEVMARIGAPDMTAGGKGGKGARWSYLPVPADAKTITTVVFDYGKVIQVERKVVN